VEGCGEAKPRRTPVPARGGQVAWRNPHGPPTVGGQQPVGGGPQARHPSPPEGDPVTTVILLKIYLGSFKLMNKLYYIFLQSF